MKSKYKQMWLQVYYFQFIGHIWITEKGEWSSLTLVSNKQQELYGCSRWLVRKMDKSSQCFTLCAEMLF